MSSRVLALLVAAVVLLLDQLTKSWALEVLPGSPIVIIDGFLRLSLVFNPGGAFSSLQNSGAFLGVAAVVVAFVIMYMVHNARRRTDSFALGLILGGALGNLSDRVARGEGVLDGEVIDWIDWWWIPTFNVADAAIFCGVVMLLLGALVAPPSQPNQPENQPESQPEPLEDEPLDE